MGPSYQYEMCSKSTTLEREQERSVSSRRALCQCKRYLSSRSSKHETRQRHPAITTTTYSWQWSEQEQHAQLALTFICFSTSQSFPRVWFILHTLSSVLHHVSMIDSTSNRSTVLPPTIVALVPLARDRKRAARAVSNQYTTIS